MDVVLLTTELARGGAEIQMVHLARTLARRGWKVAVMTILPRGVYCEELKAAGIPIYECSRSATLSPPMVPVVCARAWFQLARWRPAVLVTFCYHGDILGRVCGRMAGIRPIVATLRTANVKTPFREMLYRASEGLVNLTISNSQAALTYMLERKILTSGKTLVIPNGMVTSEWPAPVSAAEARTGLRLPMDAFVWLAVGNLKPAKDYPTLLAAAERCVAARPDFHLLIAGSGPPELQASLRDRAAALGLSAHVQFLGLRSDVPKLIRACDAFVLSSAWEGMPNTVMEAMASGVPVVSTDAGGARELVRNGIDGTIVPCGEPDALAEGMLNVMAMEPEARSRMGASGRERIVQSHDNERIVDQWEVVLRQMIQATHR
jgi:glycosyltransferase involved in cell wall biosynthesis